MSCPKFEPLLEYAHSQGINVTHYLVYVQAHSGGILQRSIY